MILYEIPKSERVAFCHRFSAEHAGEDLRVEVITSGDEANATVDQRSFRGLDYDAGEHALDVHTAQDGELLTFDVQEVEWLGLVQPEDGGGRIEARTRAGERLHLCFAEPLLSGLLEGMTPTEREVVEPSSAGRAGAHRPPSSARHAQDAAHGFAQDGGHPQSGGGPQVARVASSDVTEDATERPDETIRADLHREIVIQAPDEHQLEITVQHGCVTLDGTVTSKAAMQRIEAKARAVRGVHQVNNHLTVAA